MKEQNDVVTIQAHPFELEQYGGEGGDYYDVYVEYNIRLCGKTQHKKYLADRLFVDTIKSLCGGDTDELFQHIKSGQAVAVKLVEG